MVLDGCGPSAYHLPVVVGLNFLSVRKKARERYAFALSDPPPFTDPQDDPQKAAVVVTVSDEGHQKIAEAIDKKINDALDAMSTTEYLSGRSPLLK